MAVMVIRDIEISRSGFPVSGFVFKFCRGGSSEHQSNRRWNASPSIYHRLGANMD